MPPTKTFFVWSARTPRPNHSAKPPPSNPRCTLHKCSGVSCVALLWGAADGAVRSGAVCRFRGSVDRLNPTKNAFVPLRNNRMQTKRRPDERERDWR